MATRRAITSGAPATAAAFSPTLPTHATGDRLLLAVVGKYDTTTIPTINQGWTLVGSATGGTGTAGNDAGLVFMALYAKDATSASETAPTVTPGATAPNSWVWFCESWAPGASKFWRDTITTSAPWVGFISDTNTAAGLTGSVTLTNQPTAGDAISTFGVIPTDLGTAIGTVTITATGLSGGTITTTSGYVENALGTDSSATSAIWEGFTGTATATIIPTHNTTGASNHSGGIIVASMRETSTQSTAPGGIGTLEAVGLPSSPTTDITFVGVATADYTATTPTAQAVSMPSGWAAGDLLLLFVAEGTAGATVTVNWTGATSLGNPLGGSDQFTSVWYKIATGTEAPTWSTSDASSRSSTIMAAYRNVDSTTPIDTTVGFVDSPAGTTHTVPSQTVTAGSMLVSLASLDGSAGTAQPQYTQPSGWTKRVDYLNNTTDNYASALADSGPQTAGTKSGHTWTTVYADRAVNVTVVTLRKAGVSSPPTPTIVYRLNGLTKVRTKTTNATSVRLKIGTNTAVTTGVQYTSAQTPNAEGLALHDWSGLGLTAGTRYYYRVMMTDSGSTESADTESTVGSFKVAPTGQTSFNFCFSACTDSSDSAAMSAIAARGDDFFLHNGDLYYADGTGTGAANFRAKFDAKLGAANHHAVFATMAMSYQASDHDGGMNNNYVGTGDTTARDNFNTVYRERMPNTPVETTTGTYYAFSWGRLRFIHADERSFKSANAATDNSSKTILGATQKQWLKDQITNATESVIVWVGDTPWTGATVANDDHWAAYNTERQEMATFITSSGKNVVRIGGDMHAVAADDGTNSAGGIAVFQAAALNNNASQKGTPYTHGPIPASGTAVVQQYGRMVVTDSGSSISLAFTGYDSANTSLLTYTKTFNLPTSTAPTGIATGEAHGSPTVATTLTTSPTAIATGEAFGTTVVSTALSASPTGIATAQALGTPTVGLVLTSTPTAMGSAEAHGNPTSTTLLSTSPTGVATGLAFGTTAVSASLTSSPTAMTSAEAFGTPTLSGLTTFSPTAIASAEALGSPVSASGLTTSPTTIASAFAAGNPTLSGSVTLSPVALSTGETFGATSVSTVVGLVPSGIATGEMFGAPTASITGGGLIAAQPSAIGSAEVLGLPSVSSLLVVGANGVPTGESVGVASASTLLPASPVGTSTAEAFGAVVASTGISMQPSGIATGVAFGTTLTTTLLGSSPASIASIEAFGVSLANAMQNTTPTGVSSALAFGTTSANAVYNALPAAISSGQAIGNPNASGFLAVAPTGKGSDEAFGSPAMSGRLDAIAGTIGSLAAVGSPVVQTLSGAVANGIPTIEAFGAPVSTLAPTSEGRPGARRPVVRFNAGGPSTAEITSNPGVAEWRRHDGDYGAWFTEA